MSDLIVERRGPALWLTLNRPEVFNCMSPEACCKLQDAWQMLETDDELRVAVVTGTGDRAFCSGADLKRLIPLYTGAREPEDEWDRRVVEMRKAGRGGFMKDRIVAKPIIAAVNGVAYAGGCELVLACDIRIATTSARFALPEAQRGIVPGAGSMVRLPRQIPYCLAMELMMTGRIFTAAEALAAGMINRVVEPHALLSETEKMVEALVSSAPLSVQAIKRVALQSSGLSLSEGFAIETAAGREVTRSEDAREGPRAFAEKRPARFRGR
ncbi:MULTISPECIES: enoyl-CoA hydratase-related protein [Bradyrhizobium]|jgi:enoyl-CoA hydratase|uniref:enoyl-CoA hydratase/isomerase family protein n=1 Tax=Bradyrhizobium TaxID=374 RepID=UPI00040B463A|nr:MULTISPECIES: enoyl-CoA hydratase-related protein [Bradyrhizobium]KIU52259.1 enoyl-CoA hydratase [Bradyrhizobium elkanii]OCX32962.1 enoyl-CoA hydratase [Bradyrhizobium sp. UASWS1016]